MSGGPTTKTAVSTVWPSMVGVAARGLMVKRSEMSDLWANVLGVHRAQGASSLAPWLLLSVESSRDPRTVGRGGRGGESSPSADVQFDHADRS